MLEATRKRCIKWGQRVTRPHNFTATQPIIWAQRVTRPHNFTSTQPIIWAQRVTGPHTLSATQPIIWAQRVTGPHTLTATQHITERKFTMVSYGFPANLLLSPIHALKQYRMLLHTLCSNL